MTRSFVHLAATTKGGAGIAAERIHSAMLGAGHQSRMIVHRGGGENPTIVDTADLGSDFRVNLSKAAFRTLSRDKYHFRSDSFSNPNLDYISEKASEFRPDAIICHFISSYMSFANVRHLHRVTGAPILWSLMDMAPFTGGCHYSWSCERYRTGCGDCPALYLSGKNDVSARTLAGKALALNGMRSAVIAGSTSLAEQAGRSALFSDQHIEIIPLAVAPDLFRPRDQSELRRRFQVDADRPLIFFGARAPSDPRKGMAVLRAALERLATGGECGTLPTLMIAGDAASFQDLASFGFPVKTLGLIDPGELPFAYAAADLFVSPSIEDSGPMMVNEAIMCGTPVAAFPIGVAVDLVKPGLSGRLASGGDADALAAAILEILGWSKEQRESARAGSRRLAVETYSPAAQIERIVALVDHLSSEFAP